ncbi:hypothetical protein ABK040_003574 [Willaertia magna]
MNVIFFQPDTRNLPLAAYLVSQLSGQKVNFKVTKNTSITLTESANGLRGNTYLAYLLSKNTSLSITNLDDLISIIETSNEIKQNTTFEQLDLSIQRLDNQLQIKTYLSGDSLSICDLILYESLKLNQQLLENYMKRVQSKKNIPHFHRYFELLDKNEKIQKAVQILERAGKNGTSTDEEVKALEKNTTTTTTTTSANTSTSNNTTTGKNKGTNNNTKEKKDDSDIRLELPNAEMGKVVTRFPPEASGFLHIGHAKAALMNNYFAKKYKGKLVMRFDDTNPDKEKEEYEHAILNDLKQLQIIPDIRVRSSDHFDKCIELAKQLINEGKAYIDDTPVEELRRMKLVGEESPNRNNSIEKNLELFEEMIKGTELGKKCVLRAKIDMKALNGCMRDPVLYRCKDKPHPATGDKYKCYPTYDFVCPVVDSLDGVTHALRTSEYNDRNEQYYWICDALKIRKPILYDFSRLNFEHTVMSKRKLTKLVESGVVEGWNDPRFPTVQGLLRRGLSVDALYQFILEQGASRNVVTIQWEKLWAINKKVIDPIVPRYCAIEKDGIVPFKLLNGPSNGLESRENPKHKKNESLGKKITYYSSTIYLDKEDALAIEKDEEVTLMDWGNAIIQKIIKDDEGNVKELEGILHLEGDFKKTKKKLTWLPTDSSVLTNVKIVTYDYLITKEVIEAGDNVDDYVNVNSKHYSYSYGDHNLKDLKKSETIQLERRGYYICDETFNGDYTTLIYIPDGTKPKKLKKLKVPTLIDSFISSDNTIPILSFSSNCSLSFTEPFWTLYLNNKIIYLDYRKPIFNLFMFLKILNYFLFNKNKMNKNLNLKEFIKLLQPTTTLILNNKIYNNFINEINKLLEKEKEILNIHFEENKYVNNLTFLILEHLQLYNKYYENHSSKINNKKIKKLIKCEELITKEYHFYKIKCFDKTNKYFYFENNYSFYSFTSIYLNKNKFHYFNNTTINDHLFIELHPEFKLFIEQDLFITQLLFNDGEYKGDVNNLNEPNGIGFWKSLNMDCSYYGNFLNGKKHGFGKFITKDIIFEGEFKNDEMDGNGELKVIFGEHLNSRYLGEFKFGMRNGYGIQYYCYNNDTINDITIIMIDEYGNKCHEWYRGEWEDDIRSGMGEFRSNNEWKYGMWKNNDLKDGIGIIKEYLNDNLITPFICYLVIYEKFKIISKKSQIPSTLLPHVLNNCSLLKQLNDDSYQLILLNNNQKTPKRVIYNGYCFRSKLEMKWAKFFESCNLQYEYECRTFSISTQHTYTPDFYLPSINTWIEIKPTYPIEEERTKAQALANILKTREKSDHARVFILYGDVSAPFTKKFSSGAMAIEFYSNNNNNNGEESSSTTTTTFSTLEPLGWCQCEICGKISLQYRCQPNCCNQKQNDETVIHKSKILDNAYFLVSKLEFIEWGDLQQVSFNSINYNNQFTIIPKYKKNTPPKKKSKFFQ